MNIKDYYFDPNFEVYLRLCPFCASNPEIRRIGLGSYAIRCSNHSCMAEQAVYSSLSEAAYRWNMRSGS